MAARSSKRTGGGWECFIEDTLEAAVEKAVVMRAYWGGKDYIIKAGPLSTEVEFTPDCAFHRYLVYESK